MAADTFHYFPYLDEYLRRMVWKAYYDIPRIHVIHEPSDPAHDPQVIDLKCTTFDAETNERIPSCLYTNIDRESRAVALLLKRERIDPLLKPVATPSCFYSRWPTEPLDGERPPERWASPIDVDWEKDLFYICSPVSGLPFASLGRREEWVGKIQNLALAQPFETPTTALSRTTPETPRNPDLRRFRFNDHILDGIVNAFTSLKQMNVVCLPIHRPDIDETGWNWEETQRSSLGRDSWGYVALADYLRDKSTVENRRIGWNTLDATRIFLSVQRRLEAMGKQDTVEVRKCVDIDGWQFKDGSYRRKKRTDLLLPKPVETSVKVDGPVFSFSVTEDIVRSCASDTGCFGLPAGVSVQ